MSESDDVRTIWIGNISNRVSEEVLYELLLQAAPLQRVKIPKDKDGKQCSYGFVTFKHQSSVPYAIELLNGIELYNQALNIKPRNSGAHQNQNSPYQQLRFPQALNNGNNKSGNMNPHMASSRNHLHIHMESRIHSNTPEYQDRRRFNDSPYSRPSRDKYQGRSRYDRHSDWMNNSDNNRDFGRRKHRRI